MDMMLTSSRLKKLDAGVAYTHLVWPDQPENPQGRPMARQTAILLLQLQTVMYRKRAIYSSNSSVFNYHTSGIKVLYLDVDVEDVLAQAVCLYASFSGK